MISKEETFTLAFAKFEEERLENSVERYEVECYLSEEFYFNINEPNASTKVYHVIKQVWTEGILELFIKNSILTDKLEVKDLVAFDATRFVKLVVEVLKLELISQEEAWGLLFLNAQRMQDTFKSTQEFKNAYYKGALFYDILFKSEEERRGEKIQNFDALLIILQESSSVKLTWLTEDIFDTFSVEEKNRNDSKANSITHPKASNEKIINSIYQLLKKEDKSELWHFLDALSEAERNQFLNTLYIEEPKEAILTTEDYLELPARYPHVSYAYYLRGIYFYHYAWEARGLGITNTVGQKNYALFYERLRYAKTDLKKAYELSPNEQTYWADLYNLVKHFKSKEADLLQEELYGRIKADAMQNPYCIQRVSQLNKARWGGSHKESLNWAREVIAHSNYGDPVKVIIFEVLIEQYNFIVEFDRDEKSANAIFKNESLQNEVNQYFDELLQSMNATTQSINATLTFWYEKVDDTERLKEISERIKSEV